MDNTSNKEVNQPVSPYLLRPVRDLTEVRLECIIRKARANAWARGADPRKVRDEIIDVARAAFPCMSAAALAEAVRKVLEP